MNCAACGGFGYRETRHVDRCDICAKFATDTAAFQAWVHKIFLPMIDDYKNKKIEFQRQKTADTQQAMLDADRLMVERYRIYRRTNQHLNHGERATWWEQRRAEMEGLEAQAAHLDNEPVVIPDEDAT